MGLTKRHNGSVDVLNARQSAHETARTDQYIVCSEGQNLAAPHTIGEFV